MVSFEIFVKSMPPSLSEWKVTPSFCFAFKIPDNRAVTTKYRVSVSVSDQNQNSGFGRTQSSRAKSCIEFRDPLDAVCR